MSSVKPPLMGLTANQFRHPLDLEATNALKQLPGLDFVIRSLLGPMAEQFLYLDNIASGILVGEQQLPDLYQLLLDACRILELEPPQLYVRQNPVPNAYTFAMRGKQPFMVIHTSLLELLNPDEIQAVMAHELGHLKCDHGVYLTLANLMILAAGQLPSFGGAIAQNLQAQIMEWLRCAELTCDRAALLVARDPKVIISLLMKLTGGSPSLANQLNVDAFLAQARAYDSATQTPIGEALKQVHTTSLTHPVPVLRAREIDRWANSPAYQALIQGDRLLSKQGANPKGGWRNW
ncbi:M48 family metallopeptidase [Trichothermofontia sp.]